MNKKLLELLNQINAQKQKVIDLALSLIHISWLQYQGAVAINYYNGG